MGTVWIFLLCLVSAINGSAVTKPSGVAQFWMDDMKVLDQLYGRTSDKEIYGETLPLNFNYGIDLSKNLKAAASHKKERIVTDSNEEIESDETYPSYSNGNRYANQFIKLKNDKAKKTRLHFLGLQNFKPISQASDPETYSYLKHLEESDQQNLDSVESQTGFKPYAGNLEEEEAYKSIQDILEAHEANKGRKKEKLKDYSDKYIRYGTAKEDDDDSGKYYRYAAKAPTKNVKYLNNNRINSRCRSGRCRKRYNGAHRISTRPYIRKIKHYRYS
ncbi:uncharacterized protein LOC126974472 [Leptidea sinapis]|uniref:Uncharacterized protein n=1 Tax=Leptidea sinapis TaxID=189913 RepID=A0A5E4QIK7_9NEOP|nr:uncharacterized protein LOC126974472 [Leptidea sinapis]XP_050677938.1 uncharacterized protein LOC126974472 [Leptidea sinapis]VVC96908.1 unnamed protein product [Leptidea sinapis]